MVTNRIVTNENNLVEYMLETQAYIETLKQELIRKIVKSKINYPSSNSSIDRLLSGSFLSVN